MFSAVFLLTWMGLSFEQGSYGYEILATGSFFEGEVEAQNGEIWQGLFHTDERGYELKSVEISIEAEHSLVDSNDGPKTGTRVSVRDEEGTLLFLLRSQSSTFPEGEISPYIVATNQLDIGMSIPLGESFRVFTTADGLFLTDGNTSQRLSDVYPDSHGEGVSVLWAGDLDGDGKIDLVLDDQPHYAYKHYFRLFLSSEALKDELVREVAQFITVSC